MTEIASDRPKLNQVRARSAAPPPRRVALVGAGVIADTHAEALRRLPGVAVVAVVDPALDRARRFARKHGIGAVFADTGELLAARVADAAHVLVPPALHAPVATPLLDAGLDVLVEKPVATAPADADRMIAAAARGGGRLGVNQNFVHHPAFARLRQALSALGPLHAVTVDFHMPLRQLAARQFGHWMFQAPVNILLEQAVHPLSQIRALVGPIHAVRARAGAARLLAPALPFHDRWQLALDGAAAPAQVALSFGASHPCWRLTAIAADGVVVADMLSGRVTVESRTALPDFLDTAVQGLADAAALGVQAIRGLAGYAGATLRLTGRADLFFRSMAAGIAAFHGTGPTAIPLDGPFGRELVAVCDEAARQVAGPAPAALRPARPNQADERPGRGRVAVLGGTGFIGQAVVERLLAEGRAVTVLARQVRGLPPAFERTRLVAGDIADPAALARSLEGAAAVINLAQGVAGSSDAEIEDAMARSARTVGEACLTASIRLVHAGTIAALYLGGRAVVTGSSPLDPELGRRAVYARGKARAELAVRDLQARGLALVVLRPGVVVGPGASPFHSGVGYYNAERHCLGWNAGTNPLPFVLVGDVADAFVAALDADVAGRCFNLVGDVRIGARDYIAALAAATGRPLRFHPQSPLKVLAVEGGKWAIKRAVGRPGAPPSRRDFLSRGMTATFDCSDAKAALGWRPVADRDAFIAAAIQPFAPDAAALATAEAAA